MVVSVPGKTVLISCMNSVPENLSELTGPLEYKCTVNGTKGKAFLDTGLFNLPVNLGGKISSVFVSQGYAKSCGLNLVELPETATQYLPAKFDITVANNDAMQCTHMVKGVTLRMSKHKEQMDMFVIPSDQFDVVLGRQWFKLRRPNINHLDDSLHFASLDHKGQPRTIIVPHAGMVANKDSFVSYSDASGTDVHTSFANFWHSYRHSREYLEKTPVSMLRITAKSLGELVNLPQVSEEEASQFDPPDDRFLGDHTAQDTTPDHMETDDVADMDIDNPLSNRRWKYKGTILNTNHPLHERPPKSDLDQIMWDEFGDDGLNRFPQEIPDFNEATLPNIDSIIKLMPEHEHDYPCQTPRKLDQLQQKELLSQLQYYLQKGWIRPSSSPYGACILFVAKKNGKFRLCFDYRNLNKITVKDKYPLPDAEQVIEQLQGAKHFSQLDLAHGYHQCILAPEDVEKTAFRTMFGSYEWRVMTFGFCNAVPTFVRFMNNVLHEHLGRCCMVFIDDVVIYSQTKEQHIIDCRNVMQAFTNANLYVNWAKSQFDVDSIQYLGLNITRDGVTPFADKVEVVKNWEPPTSIYHLRSFLGAVGYYRKFIFNFAKIAKPLTDLTKANDARENVIVPNVTTTKWGRNQKTQKIDDEWTQECQQSFDQLKQALSSFPVLQLPDPTTPYEIMTDASQQAAGAVLMQRDSDGNLHPVAFFSAKHLEAESKYPVHEFELLAIFKSLKQWRHLLIGSPGKITIYTDHKPLTHLLKQDKLSPRQERWITYLADYDVDILAVEGTSNKVADCLSRYNYDELTSVADGIKEHFFHTVQMSYAADSNDKGSFAMSYAMNGFEAVSELQPSSVTWVDSLVERPATIFAGGHATDSSMTVDSIRHSLLDSYSTDHIAKLILSGKHSYVDMRVVNGVIVRTDRDGRQQLYVPEGAMIANSQLQTEHPVEGDVLRPLCTLREELLRDIHSTGHIGTGKMIESIRLNYWWPRMRKSISSYVRGCKQCQMNKQRTHKEYGRLRTLELPTRRWARINIDFIVALPKTKSGYDAIMVVIDGYSKRAHFIPTHTTATAPQIAQLFYEHIWKLHGLPIKIVSDRDKLWTSKFWRTLMGLFGSELAMSTPFHPQTDGLVERTNLTLKEMLRAFSDNARMDWDLFLPAAEFVYNSTYNTSIKDTPFNLDTGQQPLDPHGVAVHKILQNVGDSDLNYEFKYDDTATQFIQDWNDRLVLAKEHLEESVERMEHSYAGVKKAVEEGTFKVGGMVYLDGTYIKVVDKTGSLGARKALDKRRLGPYEITEVLGDGSAVKLKLPSYQKFHNVQPVSRLELVRDSVEFPEAHKNVPYLPVIIDEEEEYEIEKIIRHKTLRGKRYYHVKYLGYDEYEWKLRSDMSNAAEILHEYELEHKLVNAPVRRSSRLIGS